MAAQKGSITSNERKPSNLTADTLREAAQKVHAHYGHAVQVAVTSLLGERKLWDELKAAAGNAPSALVSDSLTFFGMKIRSAPEIESEHAFFFECDNDAEEFLNSVRQLKAMGLDWASIVKVFEAKLR